jgi:hypothetical protein
MTGKEKNTPKESIQQQDENVNDKQQPATPTPPQRKDPNAKPTSDKEEKK